MEIKKFLENQGIAYGTSVDVYDEDSGTWVGHSLAGLLSDFKDQLVKESDYLPCVSERLDIGSKVCMVEDKCPTHKPKKSYIQWHDWAESQAKKGIKQTQCEKCKRWFFPSEF